jgi:type II secretory ATPase GspE/PulE/Tfp pilus assembly ATPase PilB-like protein
MGVEPFLITSSLLIVGAQRLVRRICPSCKEPYEPDKAMIEKLKLSNSISKIKLYRGKGCDKCLRSGYKGRIGLLEMLSLNPKIKALILSGAEEHVLREQARTDGMVTLRENGMKLVAQGQTTIDEVLRVTVGDQDQDTV